MADNENQVLYLENDEEITSAIEKLGRLKGGTVQVVVPKRSTLLQSAVNQKLLKKAAQDADKRLVIVTTDKAASRLAAKVGLAVASKMGAEAVVPEAEEVMPDTPVDIVEGEDEPDSQTTEDGEPKPDATDQASGLSHQSSDHKPSYAKPMMVRKAVGEAEPITAASKRKGPRVPDFNSLQKKILWGALALTLIVGLFVAQFFLETAKVTLFAKGTAVSADFDFTVDAAQKSSDSARAVLSGQKLTSTNNLTGSFTATGKKDAGTKAHGNMTVKNCADSSPHSFVAGTRFQSPDGKIFKSDSDVTVPGGSVVLGSCNPGQATVAVTADLAGDSYNLGAGTKYTIPALPAAQQTYITGTGDQMSGGTTKTVTVVTKDDIDKAKAEILDKDKEAAQKALESKAQSGYRVISESFAQTPGTISANPAVDQEATTATLTINTTYTELAVSKSEFEDMVKVQEQKSIGAANQVYDSGIDSAKITAAKQDSADSQNFHFAAQAFAGAKLDQALIAKQLTAKKYGDAADSAGKLPGVDRVEIALWPSWSSKLPSITKHITVEIKVSGHN